MSISPSGSLSSEGSYRDDDDIRSAGDAVEEGSGVDENEEVVDVGIELTKEIIAGSQDEEGNWTGGALSHLHRVPNDVAYAYVRCDLSGKNLGNIQYLERYPHIQHLDLSNNRLVDLSGLDNMSHLLTLNAEHNELVSLLDFEWKEFLQIVNLSHNHIEKLDKILHPHITHLNLSFNRIGELTGFAGVDSVKRLEMRGNSIISTAGLPPLPACREVYFAENKITDIADFNNLSAAETIHLRDNRIARLDGFATAGVELKALKKLNLRGNDIEDPDELDKLAVLPVLESLNLSDNPIVDVLGDGYRVEVVSHLPKLKTLDKDPVDEEERESGAVIAAERLAEAEALREAKAVEDAVEDEEDDEEEDDEDEGEEEYEDDD